ncbi:MAG: hypothetical protein ACK49V_03860, partial [Actinomycetes bacterium]
WNPAGLPVGRVQKMVAAMDAQRPAGTPGLEVYYRSFVQAPSGVAPTDGDNMVALVNDAVAAREAGFADLCIEHNFWSEIQSPEDWVSIPEKFLPVLEAARG